MCHLQGYFLLITYHQKDYQHKEWNLMVCQPKQVTIQLTNHLTEQKSIAPEDFCET